MTPVSPVIPGLEAFEVSVGSAQKEFIPLPALIGQPPATSFISRWQLTDEERASIAAGADIYSIQSTFGGLFQPLLLMAAHPAEQDAQAVMESFGVGVLLPASNIDSLLDKTR